MDACHARPGCETCPRRLICPCLGVSEETVLAALEAFDLRTVKDVRQHTGAGDGCTACHTRLRKLIERRVSLTVCQASA